jgi:D-serine deaminase-like pyridoxal phosphate-dependent protein
VNPAYALSDVASVFSPSLVFFPELIRKNIARVIEMAGSPERLRPHVKTHKTREIAKLLLDAGVTKHKCATIAEAEMLAGINTPDVLIAYPLVGPNVGRLVHLIRKFPNTNFSTLIDDPDAARSLSSGLAAAGVKVGVLLDLDVGHHRTGIAVGDDALALYELASRLPGLTPNGFQLYDGHNNQPDRAEREKAVREFIQPVLDLRKKAEARGIPVPRLVCGGTPSFPVYAGMKDVPGIECSPGTFVLHDAGYGPKYPDLAGITPAAVLVTRVISRPTANRVTLDLGNKSVAADPLLEKRVHLLDFPAYKTVGHNEEHLIVETDGASKYKPGDVVFALPGHICPTVALHKEALVAEGGKIVGKWTVASRDRVLSI